MLSPQSLVSPVCFSWYSILKLAFQFAPRLQYCWARGVHYLIENPISSLIWRYRPLRVTSLAIQLLYVLGSTYCVTEKTNPFGPFCPAKKLLRKHGARQITLALGAYGSETQKNVAWCNHTVTPSINQHFVGKIQTMIV